jgi:outer membrane biosynthesis protein TonB
MRKGLIISGAAHAAVLLWSVLVFTGAAHRLDPTEPLPVDIISTSEFSQITKGAPNAPKAEQPKPIADKVGEATPVDDPAAKPAKKEVKAAADTPPVPEPKPPEPKPKRPPATAAAPDPIADAIRKDETRKPDPKQAEAKLPAPVKKPAPPEAPPFDPRKTAELLNKLTPQRVAAAGDQINDKLTLGTANGNAAQISQYELDALKARLYQLWNTPPGARDRRDLSVTIRVKFKRDGTVDGTPKLMTSGSGPLFTALSESAVRAIFLGQPFTMLKPEHYDVWNEIDINFDPTTSTTP